MQKPADELLVAYLDGELDESQRAKIEDWLKHDGAAREKVARLSETTTLLRAAFDEVPHIAGLGLPDDGVGVTLAAPVEDIGVLAPVESRR